MLSTAPAKPLIPWQKEAAHRRDIHAMLCLSSSCYAPRCAPAEREYVAALRPSVQSHVLRPSLSSSSSTLHACTFERYEVPFFHRPPTVFCVRRGEIACLLVMPSQRMRTNAAVVKVEGGVRRYMARDITLCVPPRTSREARAAPRRNAQRCCAMWARPEDGRGRLAFALFMGENAQSTVSCCVQVVRV